MAAIGRKNLKEQGTEPAQVKEKTKDEATEAENNEIVEEVENAEVEANEMEEGPETVEVEEAEPIETGKQKTKNVLKAITHILYNGRMYEPQEELPVDNAEMIEAWTDAGTAIWD